MKDDDGLYRLEKEEEAIFTDLWQKLTGAKRQFESMRDQAKYSYERYRSRLSVPQNAVRHPFLSLGAAFAVGYSLSRLFKGRREQRYVDAAERRQPAAGPRILSAFKGGFLESFMKIGGAQVAQRAVRHLVRSFEEPSKYEEERIIH